ncbi:MAG: phosphotransferase [Anaerolinea sp.]|nr:phosphotransferase [Anaerolinea sp.]
MGYADLHIHSLHSYDGTASISAILKYASTHTDLNVIAITDHDTISGVFEAVDLAPRYNLQIIPGVEVSTKDGHVLCLFIDHLISSGLSLLETVLRTGDLGGFCVIPHPQARGVNGLRFSTIREVLKDSTAAKILVGVEAFNGGAILSRRNPFITNEAQSLPIAQLGGSDAHMLKMIGEGSFWFNGNSIHELKKAIENRTTFPRWGQGLPALEVITSYIPAILLRFLGWVSWNEAPDAPIRLAKWMNIQTQRVIQDSV